MPPQQFKTFMVIGIIRCLLILGALWAAIHGGWLGLVPAAIILTFMTPSLTLV